MRLFGTAGIRGITNADITPQLAVRIGLAYGTVFSGRFAVARDTRHGAEMIEHAVISGLLSTGNEVVDLGVVPLPVFARYVADFMDGGIIVTGSHTPPEIVGIVAVDSLGRDLYWDRSKEIENTYSKAEFRRAEWRGVWDSTDEREEAIEHYTKFIERKSGKIGGFRIALDLANGSAAGIWDSILESLGLEVTCINCVRKHIPRRPSEPRRTTLVELGKISRDFDLGAGVDVDADRVVFAHRDFVSEDAIGALFATRFAKRMVTPINSSSLIEQVSKERGIEVIYCPIGPPEIAETILKSNADFGYEETGKYVFPPDTLWGDSLLSIVKLLGIMAEEGKELEDLIGEFPRYYQVKEKVAVPRELKRRIVEDIGNLLERDTPEGVRKVVRIDGVKLIYDDSWLLIRASGTEDVIRVFSDSRSEEKARELVEFGKKLVMRYLH